jgi:hypothetical protein
VPVSVVKAVLPDPIPVVVDEKNMTIRVMHGARVQVHVHDGNQGRARSAYAVFEVYVASLPQVLLPQVHHPAKRAPYAANSNDEESTAAAVHHDAPTSGSSAVEEDPSSQVYDAMPNTTTARMRHFLIENATKVASQEEAGVGMRNVDVEEEDHWDDHRAKNPVQLAKRLVGAEDQDRDRSIDELKLPECRI